MLKCGQSLPFFFESGMVVSQDCRGKQNHKMSYTWSSTRNENKYITLSPITYLVIPLPRGISPRKCRGKVFANVVVEIIQLITFFFFFLNFSLVQFRYITEK